MKTVYSKAAIIIGVIITSFLYTSAVFSMGNNQSDSDTLPYVIYEGKVVSEADNEPLTFATLNITGTNIATICNSEGRFSLKVNKEKINSTVTISYTGYVTKEMTLKDLAIQKNKIKLQPVTISLAEVNVFPKDPNFLIRAVLKKRDENYMDQPVKMTSFYRETIKKGRNYVSLSEAVVDIIKQSYKGYRPDYIQLRKARKSADYEKLDTLVFKLMGGPYTSLMLDLMKNPYLVFTSDMFGNFTFTLKSITRINNRLAYVLHFDQKEEIPEPLYSGKLYIDSESMAIINAEYSLNVSDKSAATEIFIKKKPFGADVFPTEATYMINYREKDGKWFYSYSRGLINFKVNWKKKLFNTNYLATIEMATTDWEPTSEKNIKYQQRLKHNVIMHDAITGFSDINFWGKYNVIEPEKSIEMAIKKIRKNLETLE